MTDKADKDKETVPGEDAGADAAESEAESREGGDDKSDPPGDNALDADFPAEDRTEATAAASVAGPRRSMAGLLALVISVIALAGVAWLTISRQSLGELDFAASGDVADARRDVESLGTTITALEARVDALAQLEESAAAERSRLEGSLRRDIEAVEERFSTYESLPPRVGNLETSVAAIQGIEAGARDTLLLAEAEYYLKIANALLTLGGDVELARVALGMADDRVAGIGNPALNNVRQSISDSMTALDLAAAVDIEKNAMLLASLARLVDSLPLKAAEGEAEIVGGGSNADDEPGKAGQAWSAVKQAVFSAVKVTRPGDEETPLLLPGTEPLIRANLALQLQAARLALLRGEQSIFDQSLEDADVWLDTYFDTDSLQVQSARTTLEEIQSIVVATELPDISAPLTLLRQYEALSETAP
jgi:uroporphyrin-3 C-methyltransferase